MTLLCPQMMNSTLRNLLLFFTSICFAACKDADQVVSLTADHLYFEYNITGTEDKDSVTLRLEFRRNIKGRGLLLTEPAKVQLDGEQLVPDSSKYSGVFYEAIKIRHEFEGAHTISFKGADGKELDETFQFLPIRLKEELPAATSRKPFVIRIDHPDTSLKTVQLVMLDTSFRSKGFNDDVPIRNGEIAVSENMLDRLVSGPIIMEIHSETDRPLAKKPKKGGRVAIYYSLHREFVLE